MEKQEEDPPFKPEILGKDDISYFDRFPDIQDDEELIDDPDGDKFKWCDEFWWSVIDRVFVKEATVPIESVVMSTTDKYILTVR